MPPPCSQVLRALCTVVVLRSVYSNDLARPCHASKTMHPHCHPWSCTASRQTAGMHQRSCSRAVDQTHSLAVMWCLCLRRRGLSHCFAERHTGPAMPEAPADVLLTSHNEGIAQLEVADDSEQPLDWRDELSELASSLQRCSPCPTTTGNC